MVTLEIRYPATLGQNEFESAIRPLGHPLPEGTTIEIDHRELKFAPLDVLVSAVFLYNELSHRQNKVILNWGAEQESFGYAERMGFFSMLSSRVRVTPERPEPGASLFDAHQGGNPFLLEMTEIAPNDRASASKALDHIRERLHENLSSLTNCDVLVADIWTFAAETLDNIYEHSETPVPGIVAAQRYHSPSRGVRLHVVIADGGLGIPATVRTGNPRAAGRKTDVEIILAAFREGISRRVDAGHGCGLTTCARIAMRYKANLRVRVGHAAAKLITKSHRMGLTLGFVEDDAVEISGTHISLDFYLDRLGSVE